MGTSAPSTPFFPWLMCIWTLSFGLTDKIFFLSPGKSRAIHITLRFLYGAWHVGDAQKYTCRLKQ